MRRYKTAAAALGAIKHAARLAGLKPERWEAEALDLGTAWESKFTWAARLKMGGWAWLWLNPLGRDEREWTARVELPGDPAGGFEASADSPQAALEEALKAAAAHWRALRRQRGDCTDLLYEELP